MQPNTPACYDLNDAERAVLSESDVAQIAAVYAKQRITLSGVPDANLVNLPAGHQGEATLARDREPVRLCLFGKIISLKPPLGVIAKHREHLPPERQQPEHLIREIGLELVMSEALATQGMSKLRTLFSEHAATAWNLGNGQSITFNTPNLTAKPQVVFVHHQLITPKVHWEDVTGGEPVPEAGVVPPVPAWDNTLDLTEYGQFYADVRKGVFAGRKCAEGYPTPLPVTVDGHPERFAHTILREGDLCAVVSTIDGRAWKDRSSGKWHGRLTFVPLRIRVHGQNDMTCQTTPPQTVRLSPRRVIASPVKRSAMDADLEIDLSRTDGRGVTDHYRRKHASAEDSLPIGER